MDVPHFACEETGKIDISRPGLGIERFGAAEDQNNQISILCLVAEYESLRRMLLVELCDIPILFG